MHTEHRVHITSDSWCLSANVGSATEQVPKVGGAGRVNGWKQGGKRSIISDGWILKDAACTAYTQTPNPFTFSQPSKTLALSRSPVSMRLKGCHSPAAYAAVLPSDPGK